MHLKNIKHWFFLLFYLPILLQASWEDLFSEDDDPGLFHHVQVISGHLNFSLQDDVVQGAKPLPLMRTYSSAGALEKDRRDNDLLLRKLHKGWIMQGGWSFLSHTNLLLMPGKERKDFKAYLAEPGGGVITYAYSHREGNRFLFFKPTGLFPSLSGNLGAKNNPENNLLRLDLKKGISVLFLPDGGIREYQGSNFPLGSGRDPKEQCYHRLIKEVLPSKHQVLYGYDNREHLNQIRSTSPDGDKTYATVDFTLSTSPLRLRARTSDGKDFYYQSLEAEEREYQYRMESPNSPLEIASFVPSRKGLGYRINGMNIGGREQFKAHYYGPNNKNEDRDWAKKSDHVPFYIDKVKMIEKPVGPNGEMASVARFSYEKNCTEVRDAENLKIRYLHDGEKLTQIEYFDQQEKLCSIQKFYWEGSRLRCKAFLDPQGKPLIAKTFAYDAIGNVIEEGLWGDLTGNGVPLILDESGSPSGEGCRKWYTYLPHFNLPLIETEENGLTYKYEYLPETNLVSAKFTCQGDRIVKREFWGYNQENLLVSEIIDDGSTVERNDCSSVTERHKKDYLLDSRSGLPVEIREIYWDPPSGQDRLLRRVHLTYSPANQVIAEDVYDAEGTHRYTLHTEYDRYGRVVHKAMPLDQESSYTYDAAGNLASSKEPSSEKRFGYDAAGRQTYCLDVRTGSTTSTTYDLKGRTLSQTDSKGNTIYHVYDGFGRCLQTTFSQAIDDKGKTYTPRVHFTYDIQGNLSSSQMPGGEISRTWYTAYRMPKLITRPDGSEIRYIYNTNGSLAKTIHPDGSEEHYTYDPYLRMTSKQIYSAEQELLYRESWSYSTFQLISHTDPRGLTTTFTYDGSGRKIKEQAEGRIITYQYDPLGFLQRTDNGSSAQCKIHDILGRTIEEWEEDASGRIENRMSFTYDWQNLKIQARRNTSKGEARDLFSYDGARRLIHHTDPEGNITRWIYDETYQNSLGQRVLQKTTIDPLGCRTIETEDAAGRLAFCEKQDSSGRTLYKDAFFCDRSGNRAKRMTTVYHQDRKIRQITSTWVYDCMGRIVEETEADKKITRYAYDLKGRLIYKCLPSNIAFSYVYDGADRILEHKSSDGSIHYQYFYDLGPDPICILDCIQNFSLKRTCNLFGQVTRETGVFDLEWIYDNEGRCRAFLLPDHSCINYTYAGVHLTSVQRQSQNLNYEHRYIDFDVNGHVIEEELIASLGSLHTSYDILERPTTQSSSYLKHYVTYGPTGLITSSHSSLFGKKSYEHDPLSQLKKENDLTYSFDSLGNPTDCQIGDCNEILSSDQSTFSYDLDGNPIERIANGQAIQYHYDALGRLIEIVEPNETTRFVYDPLSRLISKQTPDRKLFFLYDKDKEIGTINEQGEIVELKILGLGVKGDIGAAVALELQGELFAPVHDLGGNLIALLNLEGHIVESYDMDAFGNASTKTTPINPWRFCSKRSTNNLIFFGIRFYDPALKRWLTPDPSGFADGPNLYLYVCNSPLRRLDLFGLFSEDRFGFPMQIDIPIGAIPRTPCITTVISSGILNGTPVDYFVSCGHWHQVQFTPEEVHAGKLNLLDHFGELLPKSGTSIGLITVGNGINTNLHEFGIMHDAVRDVLNGTLMVSLHNPTEGLVQDAYRTLQERAGVNTPTVCRTRQFMATISEALHKVNPDILWLYLAHSENGVISKRALEGLSSEHKSLLQKDLYLYAAGPADPICKEYGKSVINVYSSKDYVTKGFAKPYLQDENYDIQFLKCESPRSERILWGADHGFLAKTYKNGWADYIFDLRNGIPFYQGGSSEKTR